MPDAGKYKSKTQEQVLGLDLTSSAKWFRWGWQDMKSWPERMDSTAVCVAMPRVGPEGLSLPLSVYFEIHIQ